MELSKVEIAYLLDCMEAAANEGHYLRDEQNKLGEHLLGKWEVADGYARVQNLENRLRALLNNPTNPTETKE